MIALSACQAADATPAQPAGIVFPTVTPGNSLRGVLATVPANIANPATVVALANAPTPTPDIRSCPAASDARLPDNIPDSGRAITSTIVDTLSAGGSPVTLADDLRSKWEILTINSVVRADVDLTGEGTPEVILSYFVPNGTGTLMIAGCLAGRYVLHYQATSDDPVPPAVPMLTDMNRNGITDVLYTAAACEEEIDECSLQVNLIGWQPEGGRFISLLGQDVFAANQPEVIDFDNDEVNEILIRLTDDGNVNTGPLRTGVIVYDWNGAVYVPSINQLDPPQYRIQILHQADRYLLENNIAQAELLYEEALIDDELETWLRNEDLILETYAFYRVLLVRAAQGDLLEDLEAIVEVITERGLEAETPPPYVELALVFWSTYQTSTDIAIACEAVQDAVAILPEALDLLNRYGNRSPTYTTRDLCPF